MSEDEELEHIKRKRLLEIQKRLLIAKTLETQKKAEEPKLPDPKEILTQIFSEDAWKVYVTAEQQYPQVTKEVTKALITLKETGKIQNRITGEQLYWLYMQLGVRIRMETKIRILEGGELKTIADKLRGK